MIVAGPAPPMGKAAAEVDQGDVFDKLEALKEYILPFLQAEFSELVYDGNKGTNRIDYTSVRPLSFNLIIEFRSVRVLICSLAGGLEGVGGDALVALRPARPRDQPR